MGFFLEKSKRLTEDRVMDYLQAYNAVLEDLPSWRMSQFLIVIRRRKTNNGNKVVATIIAENNQRGPREEFTKFMTRVNILYQIYGQEKQGRG